MSENHLYFTSNTFLTRIQKWVGGGVGGGGVGGGGSLIWPIQGCATGQGMVFDLPVLNMVCNFVFSLF